ncbi:MAG TPA: DUF5946 family protein [Chloroflexia bacterium]|nr:DUF5946 family protein [Chloroflexia bacterium]
MDNFTGKINCTGCGALVDDLPEDFGPDHKYLGASPGCWQLYTLTGAKEFPNLTTRSLFADTYMVQHPGTPSRQAIQSVARHLLGLYWTLERGLPFEKTTRAMQRAPVERFEWLLPPASLGPLTIVDIANNSGNAINDELVRQWAVTTWQAWATHHRTIREWATLSFPDNI